MPERRPLSIDELHALSGLPTDPESLAKAKDVLPSVDDVLDELGAEFIPSAEAHQADAKGKLKWDTVAAAYENFADLYHKVLELYKQRPNEKDYAFINDTIQLGKSYAVEHRDGAMTTAEYIERLKSLHYQFDLFRKDLVQRNLLDSGE